MTTLQLRFHPDPILRTVCVDCSDDIEERQRISKEMIAIMLANKGYGLAANQVGCTSRMFVMRDKYNNGEAYCNPVILSHSKNLVDNVEEGCLSVPNKRIKIPRYWSVELQYTDVRLTKIVKTYTDIEARCIQHEIDHLNGILIFDHIKSNLAKKIFLEKYSKSRRKV